VNKLNLLRRHACQSESNTRHCFARWLEEEFLLLSRDLTEAKKESLQGMLVTRSNLSTGMSNFLMALRLESANTASSSCRSTRSKRHNRSSILEPELLCQESLCLLWQPQHVSTTTTERHTGCLRIDSMVSVTDDLSSWSRRSVLNRYWLILLNIPIN